MDRYVTYFYNDEIDFDRFPVQGAKINMEIRSIGKDDEELINQLRKEMCKFTSSVEKIVKDYLEKAPTDNSADADA